MRKLIALVLAAFIVATPSVAEAKTVRTNVADTGVTVIVENHLNSSYPVQKAMNYVDQYTGSHFVLGTCIEGTQCIKTSMSSKLGKGINAYTYWYTPLDNPNNPPTTLQMATSTKKLSSAQKMIVLVHELGHARNLQHNPKCTSVMYGYLHCGGKKIEPLVFSAREQQLLGQA